jgi:hypothetical protein
MRLLPARVLDGCLPDFDDAVAGREADGHGCLEQFEVRPLKAMSVNVVRNLGQQ